MRSLAALPWLSISLLGQVATGPLELRDDLARINPSSFRGLPLSSTANAPAGSDGRAPREGSQLPPLPAGAATVGQFSSAVSFGGGVRPRAFQSTFQGLVGEYWNWSSLPTQPSSTADGRVQPGGATALRRLDATVNFDWGGGSPGTGVGADQFYVRWTGEIIPKYSETYTLSTTSDDGSWLWINDQLVVSNGGWHGAIEATGTINLVAGRAYRIRIELAEWGGGANCVFRWQSASQAREIVPAAALRPAVSDLSGLQPTGSEIAAGFNGNRSLAANAVALDLPRLGGKNPTLIQLRARIGRPMVSRGVNYYFGSVIPVPDVDENGKLLSERGILGEEYWSPEPYSTNGHAGAAYYWSPNARAVFATKPGPVDIVWRRINGVTANPSPVPAVQEAGLWYSLFNQRVIVSGSLVKPSRAIYWTQGDFQQVGKPVQVPGNRVSDIKVVYNDQVPERVAAEYQGGTPVTTNLLQETRTLWFDRPTSQILAYNAEGRVFVELLGDLKPDGKTRRFLGFEIVDIFQQATPQDVLVDLGDRLPAFSEAGRDDSYLYPEPVAKMGDRFIELSAPSAGVPGTLFAIRETRNVNDALVYWMEEGIEGLRWPRVLSRYELHWPTDVSRYSHYLRPESETREDAKETAVLMSANNAPLLIYQDAMESPRAFLDPDLKFYTFLNRDMPAHRTLLRYNGGNGILFERVYSWLDANLVAADWSGTLATNLTAWNPTNATLTFPSEMSAPRLVTQTVDVGSRIIAPGGEFGTGTGQTYLAGYIRNGTAYNPGAYRDPFSIGFTEANRSSIIPVNAVPGNDTLEVWWFRRSATLAGAGLEPVAWPAVRALYTIQYPVSPREIVLASNAGSGGLDSLEAKGSIYYENDPAAIGYNPNEEHALMIGGQAFALRDDLNIVSGGNYSSLPFVLVDYFGADGRPSMAAFKVLREKPQAGIVFDYVVDAGKILQAPMPLPLLPAPTEGEGVDLVNYNQEILPAAGQGNLPVNWDPAKAEEEGFSHYRAFSYRDRKESFWVYRGLHREPSLQSGAYNTTTRTFGTLPAAVAISGRPFKYYIHTSRRPEGLVIRNGATPLPDWLRADSDAGGLVLTGIAPDSESTNTVNFMLVDLTLDQTNSHSLSLAVRKNGSESALAALSINVQRADGQTVPYVGRPPYLAEKANDTNSFRMRFYYKTLPGFAWPSQPPVAEGTIVPYLRPAGALPNTFVGDPKSKDAASLDIVYRPAWPANAPVLQPGQTLTAAARGLPGIRGQSSAEVLYQQSIATNFSLRHPSVVLVDPTRKKTRSLASVGLSTLPAGILSEFNQGVYRFPNLPPHLASRVYFDPNEGQGGSLVLKGEFKDETVGEKYLQLNVLRGTDAGQDLRVVLDLCPAQPAEQRTKWEDLVNSLAADIEVFEENPEVPGQFVPGSDRRVAGVGDMVEIRNDDSPVDSYALSASGPGYGMVSVIVGNGRAFTAPGEPVSVHVFRVGGGLWPGELKMIPAENPLNEMLTLQHTPDVGGRFGEFQYEWRIAAPVDGAPPAMDATLSQWLPLQSGSGLPRYTLGGAGVRVLSDNYIIMRYRSTNSADPVIGQWSPWTQPQLAEGWIKRVLAGINPFQQRVKDLYNNAVNTDVSVISQAGRRWEGAVGLNLNNINSAGLIEIYETVLRRGRDLSINAGINYGPANDALLLVAGYLNDLYSLLGDEAQADAANPTVASGVGSAADGSMATAKFSFAGQLPSLLEEELALLRGRDDFMQPGVQTAPAYNRLYWNFTRGINSGEVIYTENYNIKDLNNDGIIDAEDAAKAYPQGHGDAYGHYLTALKGYYSLLINRSFDWVPRSEAVTILGKAIQVDYVDERKFAAAAGTLAQTGLDVAKLVFRKDYETGGSAGWDRFSQTRRNTNRVVATERHWGLDHWVSRAGQGAYVNWIVGNSMLPEVDPDPTHEGIQKIDRTTVPELGQIPVIYRSVQQLQDNAEAGLTPLGLPRDSLALDIDPSQIVGSESKGHFEQLYDRAVQTLENAAFAFEEARTMSTAIRGESNDVEAEKAAIVDTELSLTTRLIELYGTPYSDDIGPGKTYPQDYAGPDLVHYAYVELPEILWPNITGKNLGSFTLNLPGNSAAWASNEMAFYRQLDSEAGSLGNLANSIGVFPVLTNITIDVNLDGVIQRPAAWTGRRKSPGRLQQAYSDVVAARYRLANAADDVVGSLWHFQKSVNLFRANWETQEEINDKQRDLLIANQALQSVVLANDLFEAYSESLKGTVGNLTEQVKEALPKSLIAGLAAGGDLTSGGRSALEAVGGAVKEVVDKIKLARMTVVKALEYATTTTETWSEFDYILPRERRMELRQQLFDLATSLDNIHGLLWNVTARQREKLDADLALQALLAEGERIQAERLQFRNRASAMIQGYRTRDVAFRLFRDEKLDRYKSLMDLASQYSLLAANAYDYETGLLGTASGRAFVDRIIQARALGVVRDGRPQITGSTVGDPGLSGALAEMRADWSVLKGRLGFNNPDAYATTASLRTERFRLLPGSDGDPAWIDVLNRARRDNLLEDADIRRMCLQLDTGEGLAVPGLVLEFSTTIADGLNLFGQPLAARDHAFSSSAFATKLFGVGVAFEGYEGMDRPAGNAGAVAGANGVSPSDPDLSFMDPNALAATPYVYLIPVGVDSMRSPPLGDRSQVRTWSVQDVTVPMPFNIGQSDYSSHRLWQVADSLSEPLFGLRKHQSFRPVPSVETFPSVIYEDSGGLARSQFTNSRLVGRSVWNSHWKLVIPGKTLLNNPAEGLDRFIRTVKDVKIHLVTYSYSGN